MLCLGLFTINLIIIYGSSIPGAMPEPSKYILSFPLIPNPMNVSVNTEDLSKNYILIIGDWGAQDEATTDVKVQTAIAEKMKTFYENEKKDGMNLLFVGTVGDNFYYDGQNCDYWEKRWTNMYGDLINYPWLAVFGNHDWGIDDPEAMCAFGVSTPKYINPTTGIPYAANQINKYPTKGCNPENYYIPDFGYYYTIPELNFEWIALEESVTICPDDMGDSNYKYCDNGSSKVGCEYLGKMRDASEDMMISRANSSNNTNFVISQHYPQNGNRLVDDFKKARSSAGKTRSKDLVWSVYGHTHEQDCKRQSSDGNCDSMLTGGGGGCCSTKTLRGFWVIGFDSNGQMTQPYKYNDPSISCEYPCGATFTNNEIIKDTFMHCCKASYDDNINCDFFDMSKC